MPLGKKKKTFPRSECFHKTNSPRCKIKGHCTLKALAGIAEASFPVELNQGPELLLWDRQLFLENKTVLITAGHCPSDFIWCVERASSFPFLFTDHQEKRVLPVCP